LITIVSKLEEDGYVHTIPGVYEYMAYN